MWYRRLINLPKPGLRKKISGFKSTEFLIVLYSLILLTSSVVSTFSHSHDIEVNEGQCYHSPEDEHHHHSVHHDCSSCTFSHSFKTNDIPYASEVTVINHSYTLFTQEVAFLINPSLHNNTGLSPPALS